MAARQLPRFLAWWVVASLVLFLCALVLALPVSVLVPLTSAFMGLIIWTAGLAVLSGVLVRLINPPRPVCVSVLSVISVFAAVVVPNAMNALHRGHASAPGEVVPLTSRPWGQTAVLSGIAVAGSIISAAMMIRRRKGHSG